MIKSIGLIVPNALEAWLIDTILVFSESNFSNSSNFNSPVSEIGITLTIAPVS